MEPFCKIEVFKGETATIFRFDVFAGIKLPVDVVTAEFCNEFSMRRLRVEG